MEVLRAGSGNVGFGAKALKALHKAKGKKRCREEDLDGMKSQNEGAEPATKRRFIIKPCPYSAYDRPYTLTPLLILPRSRLPLWMLDTTTPTKISSSASGLPSTRLFSAPSPIYGLEGAASKDPQQEEPMVAIAKTEEDSCLYAVERVGEKVHALCRLGSWVKFDELEKLVRMPQNNRNDSLRPVSRATENSEGWWGAAAVKKSVSTESNGPANRPRLAMMRPVAKTAEIVAVPSEQDDQFVEEKKPAPIPDLEQPQEPMDAQQTFETLIVQYLEALYLSRTSLAFFAKGPLSRARAAFTSNQDSSMQTYDLTCLLRSMILTVQSMDKKYRSRLPEVLKDAHLEALSDSEATWKPTLANLRGKSKKFKLKLSSDGVYKREEEFAKRWWKFQDTNNTYADPDETLDGAIRRRIAELRTRETLAQIILILEIMALEASPQFKVPDSCETDAKDGNLAQDEGDTAKPRKKKMKKQQDLKLLLDLLLDKLCIWQSVEQDDFIGLKNKTEEPKTTTNVKATNGDSLRDFCVEVIIPFYLNRLPERAASVNRKLGGPVTSPPKRNPERQPMQPPRKPGEPASRTDRSSRRSLGRTASDTAAKQASRSQSLAKQASLPRSNTDSTLLSRLIKREPSEASSLSNIPFQRSPSRTSAVADARASRAASATYKRFERQTVDFKEMEKAALEKKKKKERIEEELKNAIGNLRRPNRNAAVKEFADESDARRSDKSRRKPLHTVQVTATPKRTRTIGAHSQPNPIAFQQPGPSDDFAAIPSSFVPSSGARGPPSTGVPGTVLRSRPSEPSKVHAFSGIEETPSRRPSKLASATAFSAPQEPLPLDMLDSNDNNFDGLPETPMPAQKQSKVMANLPPVGRQLFQKPTMRTGSTTPGKKRTAEVHVAGSGGLNRKAPPRSVKDVLDDEEDQVVSLKSIFATPIKSSSVRFDATDEIPATPEVVEKVLGKMNDVERSPLGKLAKLGALGSKDNDKGKEKDMGIGAVDAEESIYAALGWDDDLDDLAM